MGVYLDYAGIGLVRPPVREAMHRAIDDVLACGSAEYGQFFAMRSAARYAAAGLLDCAADEVALVPNTSTGLHLVADGLAWRSGDEVVVFERDFPANVQPWRRLAYRGVRPRWVPMRDGRYDLADIDRAIGPATRVVAVSHVNFVTGLRADLDAICALAKPHGALVCVDAAQSLGVLPLSLSRTPVDFLAAPGHKWLGAPPGTGVFFCRRGQTWRLNHAPLGWFGYDGADRVLRLGQGHLRYDLPPRPDARRFEGGMLNFVGIMGLAAALDEIRAVGIATIWARVRRLAGVLREGLTARGYRVCGPPGVASGIVSFTAGPTPDDDAWLHKALLARGCRCSFPDGRIRLAPHYWTADADVAAALDLLDSVRGG